MKIFRWAALCFIIGGHLAFAEAAKEAIFRLHLVTEPASLAPWEQKNSGGTYLLSQVYGTLLKYQEQKLTPALAKKCEFKNPSLVHCQISKKARYSDGSAISAKDFVRSFRAFLSPENKAFRADLLFPIKGAEDYYTGKAKAEKLSIRAIRDDILEMELTKPDPEFLFNLTSPLLTTLKNDKIPSPAEANKLIGSGAYSIVTWEAGKRIRLQHREQPHLKVEFIFVSEDSVALNLYENGDLQFLRRLPTLYIPKFRKRNDFHEVDQVRFDYLGFGPDLKDLPELRQALTLTLPFSDITKILFSKGSFGCPGLLLSSFEKMPCLEFNPNVGKALLQNLRAQLTAHQQTLPPLTLAFSKQGGDDFKRSMEWIQSEWSKNLGIKVSLEQIDNKIFTEQLKKKAPTIFRKGIAPERPTCLAAMETFTESSTENYLKINTPEFKTLLQELKDNTDNPLKYKKACDKTVSYLLHQFYLIPTGPIHFTLLCKTDWTGWKLNELNHLDLSELKKAN